MPFGPDLYARFGDEFARPVVGNFDPPTLGVSGRPQIFTNPEDPLDVNDDGHVSSIDALVILNDLTLNGSRLLETKTEDMFYYDVNQDGFTSSIDALFVINFLNEQRGQGAEGEPLAAVPISAVDAAFAIQSQAETTKDLDQPGSTNDGTTTNIDRRRRAVLSLAEEVSVLNRREILRTDIAESDSSVWNDDFWDV